MHDERTLHECLDCEGCINEHWCKEDDEKEDSGLLTEGDD